MSSLCPSLYIPFVNLSCTEDYISNIFKTLLIGEVGRVDLIKKTGVKPHYMAFIHFNYWYDNIASNNLRGKIMDGGSVRIVYDDPYYWVLYKNEKPKASISLEEKLDCAIMLIENLQQRVVLLERNTPPPRPTLRRSFNL
mgnify:CR=1 FL=1|tara:strand:+ start:94 stop:513 length:420 start_codon:yes stop_codon:yes gene_type:complete